MLGFYVSGHPLDRYRIDVLSFSSHKTNELVDLKQNDTVFIIGVIVGITRKLDRNGKAFAIVSLEDFSGKIDCVFWSDSYQKYQHLIFDEQPIAIQGKIKKGGINDVPSVIASDAFELAGIRKLQAKGVVMRIEPNGSASASIEKLQKLVKKYQGNCISYVVVEHPTSAKDRRYKLPDQYRVTGDEAFIAEFESLFGKNRLLFCR